MGTGEYRAYEMARRGWAHQRGAVLVMYMFALTAILGVAALVVDLGTASVARDRADQSVRAASLAGIRAFVSSKKTTMVDRYAEAKLAAEQASGDNLLTFNDVSSLSDKALGDKSKNNILKAVPGSTEDMRLELGEYFTELPPNETDPCGNGAPVPCFKVIYNGTQSPVPDLNDPSVHVNAARVGGKAVNHYSIFRSALDNTMLVNGLKVKQVAVFRPREVCFLLDISDSGSQQTHAEFSFTAPSGRITWPATFSFLVPSKNGGNSLSNVLGDTELADQQTRWDNLVTNHPSRSDAATDPADLDGYHHFSADYTDIVLPNLAGEASDVTYGHPDGNTGGFSDGQSMMTGITHTLDKTSRPEPLNSLVKAVRKGILRMRSVSTAEDRVCLIAFDSRLWWPRVTQLSRIGSKGVDHVLEILDWSSESNFMAAMNHGYFPAPGANSDVRGAVVEALRQFSTYGDTHANKSIVLLSDGAQNCSSCPASADTNSNNIIDAADAAAFEACVGQSVTSSCRWADLNGDIVIDDKDRDIFNSCASFGTGCANNYCLFYGGFKGPGGLEQLVKEQLFPNRIKFHVLLMSDLIGPHVSDVADPLNSNRCLTEAEVRRQALDMAVGSGYEIPPPAGTPGYDCRTDPRGPIWRDVLGGSSGGGAAPDPFYDINLWYWRIARDTGGIFRPLRRSGLGGEPPLPPGCDVDLSLPTPQPCPSTCTPGCRRCTDPSRRTTADQAADAIEEVMSDTSFAIVADKSPL